MRRCATLFDYDNNDLQHRVCCCVCSQVLIADMFALVRDSRRVNDRNKTGVILATAFRVNVA